MPINDFKLLERLIKSMGVSVEDQNFQHLEAFEGGKDVDSLDQIISAESEFLLDVSPLGEIRQIALFISQSGQRGDDLITDVDRRHKYHLFNCRTLQNYPVQRKHRYKTIIELNGNFPYMIILNNEEYKPEERKAGRELYFCGNCNLILQEKMGNYGSKSSFRIEELMSDLSSGKHLSSTGMVSGIGYNSAIGDVPRLYPKNWTRIAKMQKAKLHWKCQLCNIDLSNPAHKQWLDAHHIDGDPANSTIANIKILCIGCHAEEILHDHIKAMPRYKSYMATKDSIRR